MPKEANRWLAHLDPFFGGRRLNTITGADVTAYVAMRQGAGPRTAPSSADSARSSPRSFRT